MTSVTHSEKERNNCEFGTKRCSFQKKHECWLEIDAVRFPQHMQLRRKEPQGSNPGIYTGGFFKFGSDSLVAENIKYSVHNL